MYQDIIESTPQQRLTLKRKQNAYAWGALICFSLLAGSVIWGVGQKTNEALELPNLKTCSLDVVLCEFEGLGSPQVNFEALGAIEGVASYYDYTLASGWSSKGHYVAASRDFERYSFVRVTNLENGKSVDVKITDYGPDESIYPERIIDLSSTAFSQIASLWAGVVEVRVDSLD